jgi:hypothetical protein
MEHEPDKIELGANDTGRSTVERLGAHIADA